MNLFDHILIWIALGIAVNSIKNYINNTKKDYILTKLKEFGFKDLVKYSKGGKATYYSLELGIKKAMACDKYDKPEHNLWVWLLSVCWLVVLLLVVLWV